MIEIEAIGEGPTITSVENTLSEPNESDTRLATLAAIADERINGTTAQPFADWLRITHQPNGELEARKMLCSQVRPEEMDELFRWMYDNLELWGSTQEQQDAAILIIAKGLRNIPMVADQEINLAATLVELCQIS